MKILLVEDSQHLQRYVRIALERHGYAVDAAMDGEEGLWFADQGSYDVIILDIMLPRLDGLSLLSELRKRGNNTHILLLTAKDTLEDKVKGLELGADDYLIKPFDMAELIARIQALTRRSYGKKSPLIHVGPLSLDSVAKQVTLDELDLPLTGREYLTLEYLILRHGQIVSRSDIEEHIYDMNADIMSNTVNSTISILRKKLGAHQNLIKTHRGLGYSLSE